MNANTFPRVLTVVDSALETSTVFAVHALSSRSTVFLSGQDIVSYIRSLETDDVKIKVVDFEALKTDAGGPAPAASTAASKSTPEKEDALIEGAVQIAIGVKKEVDFPSWYTNVSALYYANIQQYRSSRYSSPGSTEI